MVMLSVSKGLRNIYWKSLECTWERLQGREHYALFLRYMTYFSFFSPLSLLIVPYLGRAKKKRLVREQVLIANYIINFSNGPSSTLNVTING